MVYLSVFSLFVGCAEGPDVAALALQPYPRDPDAVRARCAVEPIAELAITCRVQAAAGYGRSGRSQDADAVCAEVPTGTWRDECHFRAGEELGREGHTVDALGHCARAGWFGRNCLTHAGWFLPRDPDVHPGLPPARIAAAQSEILAQVDSALRGAGDGLEGEGHDILAARFGYNVYLGSGRSEPAPARLPGMVGAPLRTGFAVEVARLLEARGERPTVEAIMAVWAEARPPLVGPPLHEAHRMGRYHTPISAPGEQGLPHLPVYGGGMRLVGADVDEDMLICALEALFWLQSTPAEAFVPWLDHPQERVRWTAARLVRLARPASLDMVGLLTELSKSGVDANVRWHAEDGLRTRSWADEPR